MARRPGEPRSYDALIVLGMIGVAAIALVAVFLHSGFLTTHASTKTIDLKSAGPTDGLGRKSFLVVNASADLSWSTLSLTFDGKPVAYANLGDTTPGWCVQLSANATCTDPYTFGAAALAVHPGQVLKLRGDPLISQTVAIHARDVDAPLWSFKVPN